MRIEVGFSIPSWEMPSVERSRMRTMAAILRDPNPVHWDPNLQIVCLSKSEKRQSIKDLRPELHDQYAARLGWTRLCQENIYDVSPYCPKRRSCYREGTGYTNRWNRYRVRHLVGKGRKEAACGERHG